MSTASGFPISPFAAAPAIHDAQKTPAAKTEVLEVKFKQPPAADSDASRTLQSLVKLRDIGEQYATGE